MSRPLSLFYPALDFAPFYDDIYFPLLFVPGLHITFSRTPVSDASEPGTLAFDGFRIAYASQTGAFSVQLSEIAVIGEFTTDNGPYAEDWFLVFVTRGGSGWFEASMYADGVAQTREQLSRVLGGALVVGLAASTNFCSRILWPFEFAGRPLFTFSPVTGRGCIQRLKRSMLPEVSRGISPDALAATNSITHWIR